MTSDVEVRPVRPKDLDALGEIAYRTGFFGAPARPYFPDRALFADLWIRPYFLSTTVGFVAEQNGRPLGYIIAALSWAEYRRAFLSLLPAVLVRAVTGGYTHPLRGLPYLLWSAWHALPHASESRYPAHLHLNLLPEARGLGAGGELLDALLSELTSRGVRGVQLSTTLTNEAAVALYEKRGFRVLRSRVTPLWRPWVGRDLTHVVMGWRSNTK